MMLAQVGFTLAIKNAHRSLLDMEDDELLRQKPKLLQQKNYTEVR